MSDYALTELDRRLANVVRIGAVAELDEANARVKIDLGDIITDWLPWACARAGATRTWSAPRVGEQVTVHAPGGELDQAFVGQSIYQDAHPAPSSDKEVEHTVFPDGSIAEYDSASNTLTLTIAGNGNIVINCKVATINAETSVTLDTPDTFCTGNLTVAKSLMMGAEGGNATLTGNVAIAGSSLTHNGINIGSSHTHGGVQSGGSDTHVPN